MNEKNPIPICLNCRT